MLWVAEAPAALSSVSVGTTSDVLETITDPHVHLALWKRERPSCLDWVEDQDWDEVDDIDLVVEVATADGAIAAALAEAGYDRGSHADALAEDVVDLTRAFARIMGCDRVKLRLEIVETNACRKFHADFVTARLLTTLAGPATQWVRVGDTEAIEDMRPGEVAIFKGRLMAEDPLILHRSPPIEGSGDRRQLLIINPARSDDGDSR